MTYTMPIGKKSMEERCAEICQFIKSNPDTVKCSQVAKALNLSRQHVQRMLSHDNEAYKALLTNKINKRINFLASNLQTVYDYMAFNQVDLKVACKSLGLKYWTIVHYRNELQRHGYTVATKHFLLPPVKEPEV